MIIILHILNRERLDAVGRCLALGRISFWKKCGGQCVAGNVVRALQFAGDGGGQLRLDDFEVLFRQRRGKFVVREQLHAAFELIG